MSEACQSVIAIAQPVSQPVSARKHTSQEGDTRRDTSTQAHKHTSTQAHKHTSTQAHKHTRGSGNPILALARTLRDFGPAGAGAGWEVGAAKGDMMAGSLACS
jgi:ABC-type Zn2+ transport system substrate-binding protein/surface adhesin